MNMKIKNKLSIILLLTLSLIPIQQLLAEEDYSLEALYNNSTQWISWIGNKSILRYEYRQPGTISVDIDKTARMRWKAFANAIAYIVCDPNSGLPDANKAKPLADFFQKITEYCDDQMFNDGNGKIEFPDHKLAKLLFGLTNFAIFLPGIELFARQAAAALGAIVENTGDILTEGFFNEKEEIGKSYSLNIYNDPFHTLGISNIDTLITTLDHFGISNHPNIGAFFEANILNANRAILKTLLTPHRTMNGLQSSAVDALMINMYINHPERIAKLCKSYMHNMKNKDEKFDIHFLAFTPFLEQGKFCRNSDKLPITDFDSLLCHSLASEIFSTMDCSKLADMHAVSLSMPAKFFGESSDFLAQANLTTVDAIKEKITKSDSKKGKYVLCFIALDNSYLEQVNGCGFISWVNLIVPPDDEPSDNDKPKPLIIDTGYTYYDINNFKIPYQVYPFYAKIQKNDTNDINIKSMVFKTKNNGDDCKFSPKTILSVIDSCYDLNGELRKPTGEIRDEFMGKNYSGITKNGIMVFNVD
ncbi:MAG: hypothetical protein LBH49_03695 [Puniceicoccales bacterium]|jgi:hypothetical protein|nr:hypothetical protein [Puniceicoccales bacterium]